MNEIKRACMVSLLTVRGFIASEASLMVSFMDEMTDDECMVALRAHGLPREDARILMDDVHEIMDALKPVKVEPRKPARKPARKVASTGRTMADGLMDAPKGWDSIEPTTDGWMDKDNIEALKSE